MGASEDPMIVAGVVSTQCQRVTDRQTDGRTDGFTMASNLVLPAKLISRKIQDGGSRHIENHTFGHKSAILQRVIIACYAKHCISYRKSVRLTV